MKGTLTPSQLAEVSLLLSSLDNFNNEMEEINVTLDDAEDAKFLTDAIDKLTKIHDSLCAFFHLRSEENEEEVYDENICND